MAEQTVQTVLFPTLFAKRGSAPLEVTRFQHRGADHAPMKMSSEAGRTDGCADAQERQRQRARAYGGGRFPDSSCPAGGRPQPAPRKSTTPSFTINGNLTLSLAGVAFNNVNAKQSQLFCYLNFVLGC